MQFVPGENIIALSFRPWLPDQKSWRPGRGKAGARRKLLLFPRVPVETPAPPVLGKETLAEFVPACGFFSFHSGIESKRSLAVSR